MLKGLLIVKELRTFTVGYFDWLWIMGIELVLKSWRKGPWRPWIVLDSKCRNPVVDCPVSWHCRCVECVSGDC